MAQPVFSRRALIGGLGALALSGLAGCSRDPVSSGGAAQVTYQLSWTHSVQFGGTYLAEDRGLFDELGLDVRLAPGGPNVAGDANKTGSSGPRATTASPPGPAVRAAGVLALNRASHRVAFALLANPELAGSPVRALAAAARVSVGTVHNTLAQLTEAGLLLDGQLHHAGRLVDAWAEAYRRLTIRPLAPRTLYAPDAGWSDILLAQPESGVLLGGAAAAAALDEQVRATDGIAYATALGSAVTLLRLNTDPTPFRVDVRERFWGDALPTPQLGLVPSVLIYGDLLRDGDSRSLEIATNLRRNDAYLRALG